jgi:hypothetical protein
MKWLQVLRAILNLVYFFSWISAISAPFVAWLAIRGIGVNAAGLNTSLLNSKPALYTLLTAIVIGYFFFLAMIHHLRKAAYLITPTQLISDRLQHHFYKAGLYCVIGSLLTKLPMVGYTYIIAPLFIKNRATLETTFELGFGFDSILVVMAFGIFLILFSKIIKISLNLQEEQALTV